MADSDFLDLDEGSGETGEVTNLCLLGKILSPKPLNLIAVSNVCNAAWKTRAPFTVVPWSTNIYLFRFSDAEDKSSIIRDSPWSIASNLLILQNLMNGVAIPDQIFTHSPFWVQIHGLPVGKMTKASALTLGNRFPKLLAVESSPDGLLLGRSFIRIRAEVEISKPLPKGFWLRKTSDAGKDLWISYKYEKLPDFCYDCGRLGHDNKSCKFISREEGATSGYSSELRANWIRRSQIPIEEIEQQAVINENRAIQSAGRQPESMENTDDASTGGTRSTGALTERVESPYNRHHQSSLVDARMAQFPGAVGVLDRTGVTAHMEGIPPNIPPLNIQHNLIPLSPFSGNNVTNPTTAILNPITWAPGPTPPSHAPKHSPLPAHTIPEPYFVTEPDSPKSTDSTTTHNHTPMPNILELSPSLPTCYLAQTTNQAQITNQPHSPTHLYQAQSTNQPQTPHPETSLTTVFSSLAIKRKAAPDDGEEEPTPKLLRLCAPDYNPNPTPFLTNSAKTHPKPKRATKKRTPPAPPFVSNLSDTNLCNVELFEVEVSHNFTSSVANPPTDGRVAGPKQPHSQC